MPRTVWAAPECWWLGLAESLIRVANSTPYFCLLPVGRRLPLPASLLVSSGRHLQPAWPSLSSASSAASSLSSPRTSSRTSPSCGSHSVRRRPSNCLPPRAPSRCPRCSLTSAHTSNLQSRPSWRTRRARTRTGSNLASVGRARRVQKQGERSAVPTTEGERARRRAARKQWTRGAFSG